MDCQLENPCNEFKVNYEVIGQTLEMANKETQVNDYNNYRLEPKQHHEFVLFNIAKSN